MNIRKTLIILIGTTVTLIAMIFILRMTGMLQYYRVSSPSMEPTFKIGQLIFASNLIQPDQNEMMIFNSHDDTTQIEKWVMRMVAKTGDQIESKNGFIYVNNKMIDDESKLKFSYKIHGIDLESINNDMKQMQLSETDLLTTADADTVFLFLTKNQYLELKQKIWIEKNTYPTGFSENNLCADFKNKNWNRDNFGPITVPARTFFVMGDNRHNALDSRYTGFIDQKDFLGTVLFSK